MNKKQKREARAAAALEAKNTKTVETPKAETPAKPKTKKDKSNEEMLTTANAAAVAKKITDKKDLKYVYPADVDTLAKRKKFRADCRRKLEAFEKQIGKLQSSELPEDAKLLKKVIKEAEAFQKENYVAEKKATI